MTTQKTESDKPRPFWNFKELESYVMVTAILSCLGAYVALFTSMHFTALILDCIAAASCFIGLYLVKNLK
jgi:hypothetical protein